MKVSDSASEKVEDEKLLNFINDIFKQIKLIVEQIEKKYIESTQIILNREPEHDLSKIIFSDTPDILTKITDFLAGADMASLISVRPAKPKTTPSNPHKPHKVDKLQGTIDESSKIQATSTPASSNQFDSSNPQLNDIEPPTLDQNAKLGDLRI